MNSLLKILGSGVNTLGVIYCIVAMIRGEQVSAFFAFGGWIVALWSYIKQEN